MMLFTYLIVLVALTPTLLHGLPVRTKLYKFIRISLGTGLCLVVGNMQLVHDSYHGCPMEDLKPMLGCCQCHKAWQGEASEPQMA